MRGGRRSDLLFPLIGACIGLLVGFVAGDGLRMTVPHGCRTGCAPDYGIRGMTAGAIWGAMAGILAASLRRGWKPVVGAAGIITVLVLLTAFEPK